MKKKTPPQPPKDLEPLEEPEIPEEEEEEGTEPEIEIDGPPEVKELVELLLRADKTVERLGQQERRIQRRQMVAELIARHKTIRSQAELQQLLEKRGMFATQSSISRDLRDLGVQRVKGFYVIKPAKEDHWGFDDVIFLVELVTRSGPYMTVIQTLPGGGRLVARSLEESGWDEVVGTVSDENTVFVAHRDKEEQDRLFDRLKKYLNV